MRFIRASLGVLAIASVGLSSAAAQAQAQQDPGSEARPGPVAGLFGPARQAAPVHPELDRLFARLEEASRRPGAEAARAELTVARAALVRARARADRREAPARVEQAKAIARAALAAAEGRVSAQQARLAVAAAERNLARVRAEVADLARQLEQIDSDRPSPSSATGRSRGPAQTSAPRQAAQAGDSGRGAQP